MSPTARSPTPDHRGPPPAESHHPDDRCGVRSGPRLRSRLRRPRLPGHPLRPRPGRGRIDIVLGATVRRIVPHGDRVGGVELADGRVVPADLVLVGVGVIPSPELAESIGLICDNGVRVAGWVADHAAWCGHASGPGLHRPGGLGRGAHDASSRRARPPGARAECLDAGGAASARSGRRLAGTGTRRRPARPTASATPSRT
ncbi:FAD-dependent oxidoreductase [Streptomyces sp. NPDC002476]|uniref:FAD-dependent oxidoreductase n=1 Tax=Streptomyces sp. NPDC002476 TaxID=3364648 RepID=UPI0036C4AEDF